MWFLLLQLKLIMINGGKCLSSHQICEAVKHVYSSPQQHKTWMSTIQKLNEHADHLSPSLTEKHPILDVNIFCVFSTLHVEHQTFSVSWSHACSKHATTSTQHSLCILHSISHWASSFWCDHAHTLNLQLFQLNIHHEFFTALHIEWQWCILRLCACSNHATILAWHLPCILHSTSCWALVFQHISWSCACSKHATISIWHSLCILCCTLHWVTNCDVSWNYTHALIMQPFWLDISVYSPLRFTLSTRLLTYLLIMHTL